MNRLSEDELSKLAVQQLSAIDKKLDRLIADYEVKLRALKNVMTLALKMQQAPVEGAADLLVRFCADAGVKPSMLRK